MDWFSVTYPDGTDPGAVFAGAVPLSWVALPRGGYHYPRANASGKMRTYYGGEPGMGVHLVLSGKACREAEALGVIGDGACSLPQVDVGRDGTLAEGACSDASACLPSWPAYFRWVIDQGGRARRLDLALDDRSGLLNLDQIKDAWLSGRKSSHYTKFRPVPEYDGHGKLTGYTLYFGSRDSGSSVRIYDKALEQRLPEGEHWIRVEIEFRGDRADRAMRIVAEYPPEQLGKAIAGLLRNLLRFVTGERTRGRRDDLVDWWARFLGDVASRKLGSDPKLNNIDESMAWVFKQYGPLMAVKATVSGGSVDWFYEGLADGAKRLRPHHRAMIVAAA